MKRRNIDFQNIKLVTLDDIQSISSGSVSEPEEITPFVPQRITKKSQMELVADEFRYLLKEAGTTLTELRKLTTQQLRRCVTQFCLAEQDEWNRQHLMMRISEIIDG